MDFGWSPDRFWSGTFREYFAALKIYREHLEFFDGLQAQICGTIYAVAPKSVGHGKNRGVGYIKDKPRPPKDFLLLTP